MKSQVVVLKTSPQTVFDDYRKLFELARLRDIFSAQSKTCFALECCWDRFYPAAMVPPWELEAVLESLKSLLGKGGNATAILRGPFGQRVPGKNCGFFYEEVFKKFGVASRWLERSDEGTRILERSNVIVLSTLRTHLLHYVAGSMISCAHLLRPMKTSWPLMVTTEQICERFKMLGRLSSSLFGVIDGTLAGDSAGPRCLRLFVKNYLIASKDLVALDAVAAHMMGFEPMRVPYLRRAQEEGLGSAELGRVEIVGEDVRDLDFRFNYLAGRTSVWLSNLVRKRQENAALSWGQSTFVPWVLEKLQDVYSRQVWFPRIGARRLKRAKNTEWGKLLSGYNITLS